MKIGIKTKLAVILSLLLILTASSIGVILIAHERRSLEAQMRAMAGTITDEFASDSKIPLLQKDSLAMNLLVQNILKYHGIRNAFILNDNFIVEGHNELPQIGMEYRGKSGILNAKGPAPWLVNEDASTIIFASPIVFKNTSVGYAVISFSKEFIQERVFFAIQSVAVAAAIAVALVSFLSIPMATGLLRPVFRLFKGTKEIAAGNLDYRIPEKKNKDEIGELVSSFNRMAAELKKKEILKGVFNRYVSERVADEILKEPERIRLGGDRRAVTVFFADIRDFTAHTARMQPEEIVEVLNGYFTLITEIIFRYEGTVDKFIGDAVMGVFGSPIRSVTHLDDGLKSAVTLKKAINELNRLKERRGYPSFRIGIGLDSGEVIVGNMGSHARMEYTAVGEAVNMASRLSGLAGGGDILVGEAAYSLIEDKVEAQERSETFIKGISAPVRLYNIVDLKGAWKEETGRDAIDAIRKLVDEGIVF